MKRSHPDYFGKWS